MKYWIVEFGLPVLSVISGIAGVIAIEYYSSVVLTNQSWGILTLLAFFASSLQVIFGVVTYMAWHNK